MIEMAMIDSDVSVWSVPYAANMNCSARSYFICYCLKCDSCNPETLRGCKISGMNQVNSSWWGVIKNDCTIDCGLPGHRRTNNLGIAFKCDSLSNV